MNEGNEVDPVSIQTEGIADLRRETRAEVARLQGEIAALTEPGVSDVPHDEPRVAELQRQLRQALNRLQEMKEV